MASINIKHLPMNVLGCKNMDIGYSLQNLICNTVFQLAQVYVNLKKEVFIFKGKIFYK